MGGPTTVEVAGTEEDSRSGGRKDRTPAWVAAGSVAVEAELAVVIVGVELGGKTDVEQSAGPAFGWRAAEVGMEEDTWAFSFWERETSWAR
jgi:hypothetical protein